MKATRASSESLKLTTVSASGQFPPGVEPSATAPVPTNLVMEVVRTDSMPLPPGFNDVDDVISELSQDPAVAAHLAQGRKELAAKLPVKGIAAIRLSHGLSQKQLAEAIGTKQPHIARIESGDDAYLSTFQRLAKAMGEPLDRVIAAFLETAKTPE